MKKKIEVSNNYNHVCTFTYSINKDRKVLKLDIEEGSLHLIKAIRYMFSQTDIIDIGNQYKRICPYKMYRKWIFGGDNSKLGEGEHHFILSYLDIKEKEFKENVVLVAYDSGMYLKGSYEIFIPDFLELCYYKHKLKKDEDEKYINTKNIILDDRYTEIKELPTTEELKEKGYTIPQQYYNKLQKKANSFL